MPYSVKISNGKVTKIALGFKLYLPDDLWAEISTKQSYAEKAIFNIGGIIDSSLEDEITANVINFSGEDLELIEGENVLQMVFHDGIRPTFFEDNNLNDNQSNSE